MDGSESHCCSFFATVGHHPGTTISNNAAVFPLKTSWQLAIGKIGQVVNDVFRNSLG